MHGTEKLVLQMIHTLKKRISAGKVDIETTNTTPDTNSTNTNTNNTNNTNTSPEQPTKEPLQGFKVVDHLGQDVDFRYKEGDSRYGKHLKGLVLEKVSYLGDNGGVHNQQKKHYI